MGLDLRKSGGRPQIVWYNELNGWYVIRCTNFQNDSQTLYKNYFRFKCVVIDTDDRNIRIGQSYIFNMSQTGFATQWEHIERPCIEDHHDVILSFMKRGLGHRLRLISVEVDDAVV